MPVDQPAPSGGDRHCPNREPRQPPTSLEEPRSTCQRSGRPHPAIGLLAAAGAIAALGTGPLLVGAADHLDAPTAKSDHRIDITDIYAFKSTGGTTLVVNVNPLTSPADTKSATLQRQGPVRAQDRYGSERLRRHRLPHQVRQHAHARGRRRRSRTTTSSARRAPMPASIAGPASPSPTATRPPTAGAVRTTSVLGGGKAFVGPRDDPFFFDLPGFVEFKKQLLAGSTDPGVLLGGFTGMDTFAGTNVTSIAIEVPNARLGGTGRTVGFWATTSLPAGGGYTQVERMGRPAINTVFNNTQRREGSGQPAQARPTTERSTGTTSWASSTRSATCSMRTRCPTYDAPTKSAIADVLLPDTLTVKLGDAAGFLNGRQPANDVIDAEFSLLTNGNITSDGVNANDKTFPSLLPVPRLPALSHRSAGSATGRPRGSPHCPSTADDQGTTLHDAHFAEPPRRRPPADPAGHPAPDRSLVVTVGQVAAHLPTGSTVAGRRSRPGGRRRSGRRAPDPATVPVGARPARARRRSRHRPPTWTGSAPTRRSGATGSGRTRATSSAPRASPRPRSSWPERPATSAPTWPPRPPSTARLTAYPDYPIALDYRGVVLVALHQLRRPRATMPRRSWPTTPGRSDGARHARRCGARTRRRRGRRRRRIRRSRSSPTRPRRRSA